MPRAAIWFTIDQMNPQTLGECPEREPVRTIGAELGPLDGAAADPGLLGQLVLSETQSQSAFPESRPAGHRRQPSGDRYSRQLARAEFPATEAGADFLAFYRMEGGARIRAARAAAKMSQRKLANMLDVAESTLRSWETGEHQAPMNMLAAIAKATGVRGDFLLGQTDDIVRVAPDREAGVDEVTRRALEEMQQARGNPPPPGQVPVPPPKRRRVKPPS